MTTKTSDIPMQGTRTTLETSVSSFLKDFPDLHLGGQEDFHDERAHHLKVFGWHNIPSNKQHPIGEVEFTAIRGPHGTIPVRVFYPKSGEEKSKAGEAAALIYFHGGGYTVGSVDEFENGLRMLAEESGVQVYGVDYRLAPEFRYPVQLDEYSAVIDALQGSFGKARGVDPTKVLGGGDSAGGNMTAAITLRRKDNDQTPLAAQILLYPEARVPFDTPAAVENNTGYYLECNGIFSFADHYLPRGVPPSNRYISPGMQDISKLKGLPPASVYTSGFDPLRDVGVEYALKLQEAENKVIWHHYETMTHGWLQMTAWSDAAIKCVKDVAADSESPNEPVSERRREQIRRAQKTHRQRKAEHMQIISTELSDLRASDARKSERIQQLETTISILQNLLDRHNIRYDTPNLGELSRSARVEVLDDALNQPFLQSLRVTMPSSTPTTFANDTQPDGQINFAQNAQFGIDFILFLEEPCLYHHRVSCGGEDGDAILSHSSMLQAPIMARAPSLIITEGQKQAHLPSSSSWDVPSQELERLLLLSNQIGLSDEITPVQAWGQICERIFVTGWSPTEATLMALRDRLKPMCICQGFGTVIDRSSFELLLDQFHNQHE